MKNLCLLTAAVGLLMSGSALAAPVRAQAAPPPPVPAVSAYDRAPWWMRESVITQTGFVFTEVPANRASFSATFLTVGDTADKAQAKAIEQTRGLNQALAKLGKDAVRVTTSFSMRALYEQYKDKNGNRIEDQRGDKIESYQVSLNISIEVRDTSVLEKAYALVLAASPTSTNAIYFSLQPTNEQNTWLYTQAVKDARVRATQSADAAGGRLGAIKVIDPTGRACETDILARSNGGDDAILAQDVGGYPDKNVAESLQRIPPMPAPAMASADYAVGTPEYLEAKAMANPFIQTPPLQRLEAKACVVYGLN